MPKARNARRLAANAIFAHRSVDPTGEWSTLDRYGLDHPERAPYVASPWWILWWLMPKSSVRPDSVFIDIGCGKGRIVLAAARRYRFASVIGVELSAELSTTARALVERDRRRLRARDVRIETADATTFAIPDSLTHAYMFNPFRGRSFEAVTQNIVASLDRRPRELRLIYVQPEEHDALIATGRFHLERKVHTTRLVATTNVATYIAR